MGLLSLTSWLSSFLKCEIELHVDHDNTLYNGLSMRARVSAYAGYVFVHPVYEDRLMLYQQFVGGLPFGPPSHWVPVSLGPRLIVPPPPPPPPHFSVVIRKRVIGPPSLWAPVPLSPYLFEPPYHWVPVSLCPHLIAPPPPLPYFSVVIRKRVIGPPSLWAPSINKIIT